MPRDPGTKQYSPPDGTYGEPDEVIESASHNAWLDDMASDLSAALPIEMGGTGSPGADNALENIGGASIFYLSTLMSGSIWYFSHQAIPDGFLSCDGRPVSRTQYRTLFQRIGTTFGAGNGTSTFNLPDLRSEFIRGLDDGRGHRS
ncbi:MAG: phage tail protein [Rhizobiaceae bacterium]